MKRHVNLLSEQAHRRELLRGRWRVWSRLTFVTAVVLAAWTGWEWWQGRDVVSRRDALRARYAPVAAMQNELREIRHRINALASTEGATLALVDPRPMTTLLATLADATRATHQGVVLTGVHIETDPSTKHRRANVDGIGQSSLVVAKFVTMLRESPLLRDVELTVAPTSDANGAQDRREFHLICRM